MPCFVNPFTIFVDGGIKTGINYRMTVINSLQDTGLVAALMQEASVIIERESMDLLGERPFPVYRNRNLYLILSGIGKTSAAMAVSYMVLKYSRKSLVNMGSAGAAGSGFAAGETYCINRVIDHDRSRLGTKDPVVLAPDTLPGGPAASLVTLDRPVLLPEERKRLSAHGDLIDMEGAAFVQACRRFGTAPCLVKCVTDTAETENIETVMENITASGTILHDFFKKTVLPLLG